MTGQPDHGEFGAYKRLITRWFGYFTKKEPLTRSAAFSTHNMSSQYFNVYIVGIEFPICIGKYAPGPQGFCDICLFREPCTTDTERGK